MLGPAADVSIDTYLLRRIELRLAGANWQRGGGKGKRPEPVPLPGEKPISAPKAQAPNGDDVAQRLRNLGLIPAAAGQTPASATGQAGPSTAAEFERALDDEFLAREMRRATED
ncbi:hypothetical protein [Micromonospora sp. WMMD737]|uniref:hypothetical protein n=1 Tax=Micromonospora sp. WMMD737 TaxID=3404113 RepID=UPI003B93E24E